MKYPNWFQHDSKEWYKCTHTDNHILIGVAGRESNSIDYTRSLIEVRRDEKKLLSLITGLAPERHFFLDQVHEDTIIQATEDMISFEKSIGTGDGMITAEKDICLVIRTADCVPVLLHDPIQNIVAAIHSGWKSTLLDISGKAVKQMILQYNSNPSNILAYLLPSIGPDSYEVQSDVADRFPGFTVPRNNRFLLDLWGLISQQLSYKGVLPANIYSSSVCTYLNNDHFFSHRQDDRSRNLNFTVIKSSSESYL